MSIHIDQTENVTVLESLFPCTTYHSFMSPLLYHVVHFTTGLHHTAVPLHILFIVTFNTNSVQSFNSSCIRAVFPPRQKMKNMILAYGGVISS
jgi:hypothetical protein